MMAGKIILTVLFLSSVTFAQIDTVGALGCFGDSTAGTVAVANMIKGWNPRFVIAMGDVNYTASWTTAGFDHACGSNWHDYIYPYVGYHVRTGPDSNRFWPVPGNHDYGGGTLDGWRAYFTLPNNERYYNKRIGNVEIFAINMYAEPDGYTSTSTQANWIHAALSASTARWRIVFTHEDPYTVLPNHGMTTALRWPYREWGADAVLCAHNHDYNRVIDSTGFPYFVVAHSGYNTYSRSSPLSLPSGFTNASVYGGTGETTPGALRILIAQDSIRFEFILTTGTLIDHYTLTKEPEPTLMTALYPAKTFGYYFSGSNQFPSSYIQAKNDLNFLTAAESLRVSAIHTINMDSKCFITADWNRGQIATDLGANVSQWIVKESDGSWIPGYSGYWQYDPTSYCSTAVAGTTRGKFNFSGKKYWEAVIEVMIDWGNRFDGINTDGIWGRPSGSDIDLDHDGINDYDDISKGSTYTARQNWVTKQYCDGWRNIFEAIKSQTGKLTSCNRGSIGDTVLINNVNGSFWENTMSLNSPSTYSTTQKNLMESWRTASRFTPRISQIQSNVWADVNANSPDNTNYKMMRWLYGLALMHDCYFMNSASGYSIGDTTRSGYGYGHWWTWFYDEYKINLGARKGSMQDIPGKSLCYAQFSDSGVAIVNVSNTTQIISTSDISGLTYYSPPYYHFIGSQDVVWNDGSIFTSDTLISRAMSSYSGGQNIGDALILVKRPNIYGIEELIVDNTWMATTPGQNTTVYSGSWTNSAYSSSGYSAFINSGVYSTVNNIFFRYATAGSGAYATHTPIINVSGDYDVFEWHPYQGGSAANNSASVPHVITTADGIQTVYVNQKINGGKKNLLGRYKLSIGTASSVRITTVGATSGSVVDDAIFFVHIPPGYEVSSTKKVLFRKL